jgi:hypothetical protein
MTGRIVGQRLAETLRSRDAPATSMVCATLLILCMINIRLFGLFAGSVRAHTVEVLINFINKHTQKLCRKGY